MHTKKLDLPSRPTKKTPFPLDSIYLLTLYVGTWFLWGFPIDICQCIACTPTMTIHELLEFYTIRPLNSYQKFKSIKDKIEKLKIWAQQQQKISVIEKNKISSETEYTKESRQKITLLTTYLTLSKTICSANTENIP